MVVEDYHDSKTCESESSLQGEFIVPLPPTPVSLDRLDSCFSDPESHYESDEAASELEMVKPASHPQFEWVDNVTNAKPNKQMLAIPTRSFSTQIRSPRLPNKSMDKANSTLISSLSRSEEQLWISSKSTSTEVVKTHRCSSDAILEDRPPLPPRTYYTVPRQDSKIVCKPLPPIPTDEEEYIPGIDNRRKLSSSMDCLRNAIIEEEASPYLSPIDLHNQLKEENCSLVNAASSSHIPDRPPLPAVPTEPPFRPNKPSSIVRSKTQYIPGKKYGHKRSRSSNCDFLRSVPKDDKPYNHQRDARSNLLLNPYATLGPSTFVTYSMRAKSGSPESDLESSLTKSFKAKQSPVPDNETNWDKFGTYTRMSPASSLDIRSSVCQSQELLRDPYKPPNDTSSDTEITQCTSAVPPRRGERRKARRWKTNKDAKSKNDYNPANRLYWQQRQHAFEVPRYVSQPSIQNNSNFGMQRHDTDKTDSKRSSRDSNIYEHVDEEVLEDIRKASNDDYRSSAETDIVYKSIAQPGVFPHPPSAQEWHYFMYMWQLFLQWMSDHAPPEVYNTPSNVPANVGNTPPLIGNQPFPEMYDEVRKLSTTSYTSINCDWIKNLAQTQASSLAEDDSRVSGAFSPHSYNESTETNAVINKQATLCAQNSHSALTGNGKSISSVDSGICSHSQNGDSNSNGDS